MSPLRFFRGLNGKTLAVTLGAVILASFAILVVVIGLDRRAAKERFDQRNEQAAVLAMQAAASCQSSNENRAIVYYVLNRGYELALRNGPLPPEAQAFYEDAFLVADQPACPGLPPPSTLNLKPKETP